MIGKRLRMSAVPAMAGPAGLSGTTFRLPAGETAAAPARPDHLIPAIDDLQACRTVEVIDGEYLFPREGRGYRA